MSTDRFPESQGIEPLPHQVGLGPVGKGALAAGTALLSTAFPPAAIPLAGLSESMQALGERLSQTQQQKTLELLQSAAVESSLDAEEVVQRLIESPELSLLAAEAIDAARRSRLHGKARALGSSLGALIADDSLIDLESIWIRVLATVEPPHIRVLQLFLEHTGTMGTGSTLWGTGPVMKVSEVGEALSLNEAVLPLIQDLIRSGLLMDPGAEGMDTESGAYEIPDAFSQPVKATPLGAQLFARLSSAALESDQP